MTRRLLCHFVTLALFSFAGCQSGAGLNGSVQTEQKSENDADHYNRGVALHRKNDLDGALAEFRTALRHSANDVAAHTNLGNALQVKGDLDGALAEYRTALGFNPNDAAAHTNLGTVLKAKGDLDGALAEFRTALRL